MHFVCVCVSPGRSVQKKSLIVRTCGSFLFCLGFLWIDLGFKRICAYLDLS